MAHSWWIGDCERRLVIVAHRGGAALAAENIAEAISAAAAAGADAFETDVRLTRDGILVCVHDADLRRLCGDTRAVADLDVETLRRLLPGVMTLEDALLASASLPVLLDIKRADQAQLPKIMAEVTAADAMERTMLGLRHIDLIAAARTAWTDIAILAFLDEPDAFPAARRAGADWFRLWQGAVTDERLAGIRATGMKLAVMVGQPRSVPLPEYPPFPVGVIDRDGLERLLAIVPDAILLDDPRLAVASVS